MTTFTIIMEMIPGEVRTRMVEPIEADSIEHAWALARARWYKSALEEQNRKMIAVPDGETMKHISVTPQIVDIKEGMYKLPDLGLETPPKLATNGGEQPGSEPAPKEEPAPEPAPEPPHPEAATSA
jgi:hypothetical protein